jgi:hypothetical protein
VRERGLKGMESEVTWVGMVVNFLIAENMLAIVNVLCCVVVVVVVSL